MRVSKPQQTITRRDALKGSALIGATMLGASLVGCANNPRTAASEGNAPDASESLAQTGSESLATRTEQSSYDYTDIMRKSPAAEAGSYNFQYINTPLKIGNIELKNRMIKSCASGVEFQQDMDIQVEFYRQLARGGVGMIVFSVMATFADPAEAEYLRPLVEATHEEGCPIFAQVVSETETRSSSFDLNAPLGAPIFKDLPPEIADTLAPKDSVMETTEDVQARIEGFAQHIKILKDIGFDGVEINSAAEHYFNSYLSRFWNRERTDEYGSDTIENRCRLECSVIRRAHELCGDDFPIGVLFNGYELNIWNVGDDSRCSTLLDTCEQAKQFEAAGASHLQIRSVAFGHHCIGFFPDLYFTNGEPDNNYGHFLDIKRYWPEFVADYGGAGAFLDTAAKIKECVSIPVFPVAQQNPRVIPEIIDEAIGEGKIDAVAMTRAMMADTEFANKICAGDLDSIRPCAVCTHCLQGYCRVNPVHGRALTEEMPEGYDPLPAETPKKVLIAGGGPAGLECAHIAAERGHDVVLCEATGSWGGLAKTAIAVKGPHEYIQDHIDWMVHQCENAGVDLRLNTEVDADLVASVAPDVLVSAIGGKRVKPAVDGIDGPLVAEGFVTDASRVVVVGGIQCEGIQVAINLYKQGKQVSIIDEDTEDHICYQMPDWIGPAQKSWCDTHGIDLICGVHYDQIGEDSVTVTLDHDNFKRTIECDGVVLANELSPDSSLADELGGQVAEVYTIGDAAQHGLIREAVYSGHMLARSL